MDTPTPLEAYFTSVFDSYATIGRGIRAVGDFLATPYDWVANTTDSPIIAAIAGFESGLIQLPFDIVGGLADLRGLYQNTTGTFSVYYQAGGGGVYGTLLGLSGVGGFTGAAESYYGYDILTGRQLTGDERFDRGVIGAGAIGGTILSGVGTSATLSTRVANASASGSRVARVLNTQVRVSRFFDHLPTSRTRAQYELGSVKVTTYSTSLSRKSWMKLPFFLKGWMIHFPRHSGVHQKSSETRCSTLPYKRRPLVLMPILLDLARR
ncbi:MAG: hypothetical protein R3C02_18810 [Planctomycetaceae bacterium]